MQGARVPSLVGEVRSHKQKKQQSEIVWKRDITDATKPKQIIRNTVREFPADWTLCFHCRGHGFHHWSGNWDPAPHAVWPENIQLWLGRETRQVWGPGGRWADAGSTCGTNRQQQTCRQISSNQVISLIHEAFEDKGKWAEWTGKGHKPVQQVEEDCGPSEACEKRPGWYSLLNLVDYSTLLSRDPSFLESALKFWPNQWWMDQ